MEGLLQIASDPFSIAETPTTYLAGSKVHRSEIVLEPP